MLKRSKILIFLNFSKVCFFSFIMFHNGRIPTEARKSLVWNLSQDSDFSDFSRMKKKSERYAHGFGRHMQNVGKINNLFFGQNKLPKAPKTYFLSFLGRSKTTRKLHDFFRLKSDKNLTWERFWISTLYLAGTAKLSATPTPRRVQTTQEL